MYATMYVHVCCIPPPLKCYLYIPAHEMAYILRSSWFEASRRKNEGMAGRHRGGSTAANAEKHAGCQVACGMLGFVCITECFCVCELKIENVGGREAAEKHPELYEKPGISTFGNGIAAYQTRTRLYAHKHTTSPTLIATLLDSQPFTLSCFNTLGNPQSVDREPKDRVG